MREDKVTPSSLSISALINHPNATASAIRPGMRDIPPVTLSPVPKVSETDFQQYTRQIAREYEEFVKAKEAGLRQHLAHESRSHRRVRADSLISGTELLDDNVAKQIPTSMAYSSTRTSFDDRTSIFSGSPTSEKSGFDLDEQPGISQLFFDADFELKNPRTFDAVCGNAQIKVQPDGSRSKVSLTGSSKLQERLSVAMDSVETDLVEEIAATGPAIFEAIQNLGSLAEQTAHCTEHLESLRVDFQELGSDNTDAAFLLAKLKLELQNIQTLRQANQDLSKLSQCYAAGMNGTGSPSAAFSNMDDFEAQCKANPALARSRVVTTMQSALDNERQRASERYARKGAEDLLAVLGESINAVSLDRLETDLLRRHVARHQIARGEAPLQIDTRSDQRPRLMGVLKSLHEVNLLESAFATYREALNKEVKGITKRQLPSTDDVDSLSSSRTAARSASEKSANLAKGLRTMSSDDFNAMLREVFLETSRFLRSVTDQQKVLIDFVASAEMDAALQVKLFMQDLVSSLADTSQRRIVKVLQVRGPQSARLPADAFVRYYELNLLFAGECETYSASLRTGHSELLQAQVRDWFAEASRQHVQTVTSSLEKDNWQPVTLKESTQGFVDLLQEPFPGSKPTWLQQALPEETEAAILKQVMLREERYMIPSSTEQLLQTILWHLVVQFRVPVLRHDAFASIVSLTRLYHNQTWLLILGAGATKTAGLERITAKHLAIASQAIALAEGLLQSLAQLAEGVLGANAGPVRPLMALRDDYAGHREELLQKLISIMNDRTRALSQVLEQLNLEDASGETASVYMVTLVKDTTILFKVLSKFLDRASLQRIMSDVVAFAESHLAVIYAQKTADGSVKASKAVAADKAYYLDKIGALPGITELLREPLGQVIGIAEKEAARAPVSDPAGMVEASENTDVEAVTAQEASGALEMESAHDAEAITLMDKEAAGADADKTEKASSDARPATSSGHDAKE